MQRTRVFWVINGPVIACCRSHFPTWASTALKGSSSRYTSQSWYKALHGNIAFWKPLFNFERSLQVLREDKCYTCYTHLNNIMCLMHTSKRFIRLGLYIVNWGHNPDHFRLWWRFHAIIYLFWRYHVYSSQTVILRTCNDISWFQKLVNLARASRDFWPPDKFEPRSPISAKSPPGMFWMSTSNVQAFNTFSYLPHHQPILEL